MTDYEKAITLLSKHPNENAAPLGMLKRGTITTIQFFGNSVLLYDTISDLYVLAPETEEELREMCDILPQECDLFVTDTTHEHVLKEFFDFSVFFPCTQFVYGGILPPELPCSAEIRPLTIDLAPFVTEHYSNPAAAHLDYIQSRIKDGVALGAFYGDTCAGFVLTHSEGSMGMLEVLPEYRRQGIAYALTRQLVAQLLKQGVTPYGHIKLGNTASEGLQQKMGFVRSKHIVAWAFGKKKPV